MKMLMFKNRKKIRSKVIKDYVLESKYDGVVCFSCGNSSKALCDVGLYTIDVSPIGDLEARRWWSPEEIHRAFPKLFDATSGHLPLFLMVQVAKEYKRVLGNLPEVSYIVPTGSGESIVCLQIAYPDITFVAQYNMNEATKYDRESPLNLVVRSLFEVRGI